MSPRPVLEHDWDFEDRLAQIALPIGRAAVNHAQRMPAAISLTLLAVGVALAAIFFEVGFILLIFCIGFLVWYLGAAIVGLITSAGAIAGIVAVAVNHRRPAEQITGILGFVLNAAIAGLCVAFLATMWR
jgi:hypothetical protein